MVLLEDFNYHLQQRFYLSDKTVQQRNLGRQQQQIDLFGHRL